MKLTNSVSYYGLMPILLHWIMAIIIIGMFFLGEYMVDLDYYDSWYHQAPWWHKSIGVCLFSLLLIRIGLKLSSATPAPLSSYKSWELVLAKITHVSFYLLLLAICMSGYLVATAKGVGVELFAWFEIPAIMALSENQTDLFGEIHEVTTHILVVLFLLHVAAALKHHFVDHDSTLTRMLGRPHNIKKEI